MIYMIFIFVLIFSSTANEVLAQTILTNEEIDLPYHNECLEDINHKNEHFLLITGCGRSGTTYISAVLQEFGLDVRHECYGADGICSWPMTVVDDDLPWKWLPPGRNKDMKFTHILHQVRHPLKVIASFYTYVNDEV